MRTVLFITIAVIIMALVGWITFGNTSDTATVTVNKQKIKQDTKKIVKEGEELIDKAATETKQAIDDFKKPETTEPANTEVK